MWGVRIVWLIADIQHVFSYLVCLPKLLIGYLTRLVDSHRSDIFQETNCCYNQYIPDLQMQPLVISTTTLLPIWKKTSLYFDDSIRKWFGRLYKTPSILLMLVEMLWVLTLVAIQRKQRFAYTRLLSIALHHFLLLCCSPLSYYFVTKQWRRGIDSFFLLLVTFNRFLFIHGVIYKRKQKIIFFFFLPNDNSKSFITE